MSLCPRHSNYVRLVTSAFMVTQKPKASRRPWTLVRINIKDIFDEQPSGTAGKPIHEFVE